MSEKQYVVFVLDGEIETPQKKTACCERKYIAGLAKKGDKIIILLEPAAVLEEGLEVKTGKIAG